MYGSFSVFDAVKDVPIEYVIGRDIPLKKRGTSYVGTCPFHSHSNTGKQSFSFSVKPRGYGRYNRGLFTCFACGAKGDAVDYFRQRYGMAPKEAAVQVGLLGGVITQGEANDLLKGKEIAKKEYKPVQMPEPILAKMADADWKNKVYAAFISACRPLTAGLKEMLVKERRIKPEELRKYFTFPTQNEVHIVLEKMQKIMNLENMERLLGVPGFFKNKRGEIVFCHARGEAIGIAIYDREGKISGIQLRYTSSQYGRYKFMSSGYANGLKNAPGSYGTVCGFVEDVLYPQNSHHSSIALTEGRFKAEILAQLGFTVINMHSISNWKAAGEVARDIAENGKRFVLCYDSEDNPAVWNSAKNLYDQIQDLKPVEFAVWDKRFGKGIDDVVNSGNMKQIKRISPEEYFSTHPVN